ERLEGVQELRRLAARGDEIDPPPRQHLLRRQADDAAGKHIQPAEIVEQPGIELFLPQCGLDRFEIEHVGLMMREYRSAYHLAPCRSTSAATQSSAPVTPHPETPHEVCVYLCARRSRPRRRVRPAEAIHRTEG